MSDSPLFRLLRRLVLCRLGLHGEQVPSIYHDEGAPLTECSACGVVDV